MDAELLTTLFGGDRSWSSPCVVILDGEATVKTPGPDTIVSGGMKSYAPRYSTGRIEADTCCLLRAQGALLIVQQLPYKDSTGQTAVKQTLTIVDTRHIIGVEFPHLKALDILGIPLPLMAEGHEYRPGTLVG
ncbi:MAG: hypothetical protein LC104_17420 [Bacteroidales bacterium]|nr:hypothetical protein [Bacteroidales bacterium]